MADLPSVGFYDLDLEALRIRLRKMNDQELRRFGLAARFICSPGANLGKPPRQVFVIQLEEARAERERKKTEKENKNSQAREATPILFPTNRTQYQITLYTSSLS